MSKLQLQQSLRSLLCPRLAAVPALLLGLSVVASTGCAPSFKLKQAPPGFIEVNSYTDSDGEAELRMKAPDNVGINITTESNFRGGTLALWADDMVRKLGERGYVLLRQEAVESKNGVEGTRFDFRYNPPGGDGHERFYTAVLYVTDEWRVIAQLAGRIELEADHQTDLEQILGEIKITGCKIASKVCNTGQPRRYETGQPTKPNKAADTDEEAQDEGEAKPDADAKPDGDAKPDAKPDGDAKPDADQDGGD